jgi:hypothetical protein
MPEHPPRKPPRAAAGGDRQGAPSNGAERTQVRAPAARVAYRVLGAAWTIGYGRKVPRREATRSHRKRRRNAADEADRGASFQQGEAKKRASGGPAFGAGTHYPLLLRLVRSTDLWHKLGPWTDRSGRRGSGSLRRSSSYWAARARLASPRLSGRPGLSEPRGPPRLPTRMPSGTPGRSRRALLNHSTLRLPTQRAARAIVPFFVSPSASWRARRRGSRSSIPRKSASPCEAAAHRTSGPERGLLGARTTKERGTRKSTSGSPRFRMRVTNAAPSHLRCATAKQLSRQ